jgi:nucleoside 2-deoxyribosyltransferase
MAQAFIIMQIGNAELDRVCEQAIVPALKACGLDPKRVDKHNSGGLLKSEIIAFIEGADIIVADVTNERPNCYLEIGYAMGAGKFRNLVLTAREDHSVDSPNHRPGGSKVHFDLAGYDILF